MKQLFALGVLVAFAATGCGGVTAYRPARTAQGELTMSYNDGLEIWNGQQRVAHAYRFSELPDFVRCVPDAKRHAEAARSSGRTAGLLSGLSIGFAITGIAGGLTGASLSETQGAQAAWLVGGLALEVAAVALGASSMGQKTKALGHAADAVNFYNDAAGSVGGSCR